MFKTNTEREAAHLKASACVKKGFFRVKAGKVTVLTKRITADNGRENISFGFFEFFNIILFT